MVPEVSPEPKVNLGHLDHQALMERRDHKERGDKMGYLETLAMLDLQVKQAPRVNRASKEKKENQERMDWMEHLENVVKEDLKVPRVTLVQQVLQVAPVHQVPLELRETGETQVHREREETQEETARGDMLVPQVPQELLEKEEREVPPDSLAHQVVMATQD